MLDLVSRFLSLSPDEMASVVNQRSSHCVLMRVDDERICCTQDRVWVFFYSQVRLPYLLSTSHLKLLVKQSVKISPSISALMLGMCLKELRERT